MKLSSCQPSYVPVGGFTTVWRCQDRKETLVHLYLMRQCSPYIFCALHKNICTLTPGLQGRQVISPCMCHLVHPLTHPSDTFCSNAFIPRHPRPRHVVRIRSEIPPPISKGRPWQRTRAAGQLQDRAISAVLGWAKTEGGWLGMFMRRWLRWENENHTPGSG